MRIKEIKCDQFAGLQDREIEFEKGLNLVIGENETGKSTLVDLIYYLFFQDASLDGRRDKTFKERYFPQSTGAFQGDAIDGTVKFETGEGTYKLSKECAGKNGSCKLTLPDGTVIRDNAKISMALSEALQYGKGVYDELIFASQCRDQTILNGLLGDTQSDNVRELSATITRAVMETGGIGIRELEAELAETVSSYEGHWDFAADMPEGGRKRGINNRWSKSVGKILLSYYAREEIAASREAAESAEKAVEAIHAQITDKKERRIREKETRERFNALRNVIAAQNANREKLGVAKDRHKEMREALSDWPGQRKKLAKAEALKEELQRSRKKALYQVARKLADAMALSRKQLDELGPLDPDDAEKGAALERRLAMLESELKGLNLSAQIRKLGATDVSVKSAISGETLDVNIESFDITEAVEIQIPDTVAIRLLPKGVDVDAIRGELAEKQSALDALLLKNGSKTLEELKARLRKADEFRSEIKTTQAQLDARLDGIAWEELEKEYRNIPDNVREEKTVEAELQELCGASADGFIGRVSTILSGYEAKYVSPEHLAELEQTQRSIVQQLEDKLAGAAEIPAEFASIEDPDEYDKAKNDRIETLEGELEELTGRLSAAEKELGEKSAEEYLEDYRAADEAFESCKEEYLRWKHIRDVFLSAKEETQGNPMQDIADAFGENLALLSNGAVTLQELDENLGSSITSGNHKLNANILSEGTKDTISLAFRLAVLDHLYPDGGCIAVFDDPFTDMDPKRTAEACRLIRKFAEKNQVIFVTCDEKYKKLLDGNCISITR